MNQEVRTLSREQVHQICPTGADKMKLARIKSLSFTDDGLPADDTTVKLFSVLRQEAKDVLVTYATDADYQEYIDKREDVSPTEGKQRYGDVTFADAKNKKYPVDSEVHIRAAWSYINMPKNAEKYDSGDLDAIKAHIVTAWKKMIDKAGPPSAAGQKNHAVSGMKSMTRQQVFNKCPQCANQMAGSEQDMPVDAGGHMQHICGKGGRAIATLSDDTMVAEYSIPEDKLTEYERAYSEVEHGTWCKVKDQPYPVFLKENRV